MTSADGREPSEQVMNLTVLGPSKATRRLVQLIRRTIAASEQSFEYSHGRTPNNVLWQYRLSKRECPGKLSPAPGRVGNHLCSGRGKFARSEKSTW